jgi:hypothetical protein
VFTKIPALSQFCYLAAFAILFDYIFQLTTFVGLLAWIQERQDQNKVDKINKTITMFINKYYCKFILKKPIKVISHF